MKLALYSAIYGDYEATAKPLPPGLDIPAVMFTDNARVAESGAAGGWQIVATSSPYERFEANPANGDPAVVTPMLAHKYWKTHPAQAVIAAGLEGLVDTTIWIDGNMQVTMPGPEWVARNVAALGDDDWSAMAHPWRQCIYTEHAYTAAVCWGRYSVEAMQRQIDGYRQLEHPENWGLFATGHIVRRHTYPVRDLGTLWWQHNVIWSHQDQLSLPVLMRRAVELGELTFNTHLPWGTWELHPHGA